MGENEQKQTEIDVEWEIRKWNRRLDDLLDEIEELKQKNRSLSARITRMMGIIKQEMPYEEEPEREPPDDYPAAFDPSQFRNHILKQYYRLKTGA